MDDVEQASSTRRSAKGVTSRPRASAETRCRAPRAIVGTDEKFAAENAALWTDGVLVYVPKGVAVDEPLKATFTIAEPAPPSSGACS